MATPQVGLTSQLSISEAVDWALADITHENDWDAQAAPGGWNNNLDAVLRVVATLMVRIEYPNFPGKPSLKDAFRDGYQKAHLTKGYHQQENLLCLPLGGAFDVCHLTFRLYKGKKGNYRAVHIYVTSDGRIGGATLWDEQNNRPIS